MKTKDRVYDLLKQNQGRFMSGQSLADELFVTRASIWKAVKALQEDGIVIDAVTNKGYRLGIDPDGIDVNEIMDAISHELPVDYYESIASTNDEASFRAREGGDECIIIAGEQTSGRGRRGREFYSPKQSGLYMSLLIKGERIKADNITAFASVVVASAIDEVMFEGKDVTRIKWVNDIFIGERKVAGILCESISNLEMPDENYVIIGIGINIEVPREGFPDYIKNTAGAIMDNVNASSITGVRTKLASRIASKLIHDNTDCLKTYRDKSCLIGSFVKINSFDKKAERYASVTGISDLYRLCIRYEDGKEDELSSGEVSVVRY